MRILQNLTKTELDYYTGQPTAKKLHERIMKDAVYIPAGDKVEISPDGRELQQAERKQNAATAKNESADVISFGTSRIGSGNKFVLSFSDTNMVSRAVEQGYIELNGQRIGLTDVVKKLMLATSKKIQAERQAVSMQNMLMYEAANSRRNSDAMQEAGAKMTRTMKTAARIMHGKKVSPADEKELMEFNKDLYTMAKSAAALAKYRRKKDDDEDDEKISAANDAARAKEAEPKDYSVKEIEMPKTETQLTVSLEGDAPQVLSVGAGLSE